MPTKAEIRRRRTAQMMIMGAGGYGQIDPVSQAGLVSHYVGNDATTVSGAEVGTVVDRQGNYDMVSAPGTRPTLLKGSLDGNHGVQFNGVDQFLEAAGAPAFAGTFDVWMILRMVGASDILMNDLSVAATEAVFSVTVSQGSPFQADKPHLLRIQRDASNNIRTWRSGTEVSLVTPPVVVAPFGRTRLGRNAAAGYGDPIIYEVALFNIVNTKQQEQIMNYYFASNYPTAFQK